MRWSHETFSHKICESHMLCLMRYPLQSRFTTKLNGTSTPHKYGLVCESGVQIPWLCDYVTLINKKKKNPLSENSSEGVHLFFLIGNRDLYSRKPPYAEKHKAGRKIQRVQRDREEMKLRLCLVHVK